MTTAILSPAVRRFAWKEYRTLRGLWVAVLILGLLIDWLSGALLAPSADFAAARLTIALAAAALYAAGAAAILFSMEHEENTYDFLRGLPATWQPIFAGKLALAALSAIGLAVVLGVLGLWTLGVHTGTPSRENASIAFGIFGVAIFEALAWGTLWSLLLKRPLAAAVVTLITASLAANLAANVLAHNDTNATIYIQAIPQRLAIVVAVFGASVLIARQWLSLPIDARRPSLLQHTKAILSWRPQPRSRSATAGRYADRPRRRSMLLRLVWQTLRESWKLLALPVALAMLCLIITRVCEQLWSGSFAVLAIGLGTIFFGPTLYGALAFAADQKRGNIRFLAEHAAMPRYVWLSRHVVWLGALLALTTLLSALVTMAASTGLQHRWQDPRVNFGGYTETSRMLREMAQFLEIAGILSALTWFGSLAAYSIGQLCSMLIRSEILAAFVALVLSMVLSAWVAVLFAWGLSVYVFLLPLTIGFMLATWLRTPGWIEGRNTWRAWLRPVFAVAGTVMLLGVLLPVVRLTQVPSMWHKLPTMATSDQAEAEVTANLYLQAVGRLHGPVDNDPLERWRQPEFSGGNSLAPGDIDETMIPADQLDAFNEAKQKWREVVEKSHSEAIALATEASQRPNCKFSLQTSLPQGANRGYQNFTSASFDPGSTYASLDALLREITVSADGNADVPFDQLLAALRMSVHLREGQPTVIFVRQLEREQQILRAIGARAGRADLTSEERLAAIAKLEEFFQTQPDMAGALYADREYIRQVIEGKELPLALEEKPVRTSANLAMLANTLPWERKRSLEALDAITHFNLQLAQELTNYLAASIPTRNGTEQIKKWIQPDAETPEWVDTLPSTLTSYMMSSEYRARVPINEMFRQYTDTIACRRAALLQIALAVYESERKEYPPALARLAPDYLASEPLDPYSMQPFVYLQRGLEHSLETNDIQHRSIVAANTPFFRSVGPNNYQMLQTSRLLPVASGVGEATTDGAPAGPEGGPQFDIGDTMPLKREMPGSQILDQGYYFLSPASHELWHLSDPAKLLFTLPKPAASVFK